MLATRLPRAHGFTLIELMVTIVIIGILTAIAVPGYQSYLVKGNRGAAQAHLLNWAGIQSQYLADAREYADQAALESLAPTPAAVSDHYTLEVTVEDGPPVFTIVARPKAGGRQAEDVVLEIDSSGIKKPSGKW